MLFQRASDKLFYYQQKFMLKWNVLQLSAVIRTLVGWDVLISCWSWDQPGLIHVGRDNTHQMSIFIHAIQHPSSSDMSGRGALASRVRFNLQKKGLFFSQFVQLRRIQRKFHFFYSNKCEVKTNADNKIKVSLKEDSLCSICFISSVSTEQTPA